MTDERIVATYLIETPHPPRAAAEAMARQTTGTFTAVPGETAEVQRRFQPRIERITELETVDRPALPGSRPPAEAKGPPRYTRAEVVLSFPLDNVGTNLPVMLSMVRGNLFELPQVSGLRLVDLELPEAFARAYPLPQFGVAGTRKLADVQGRPILGTIVKPNIGLSPPQTAELVRQLAEAGVDFIKDDEVQSNAPHSPFDRRVEAVMRVINDVAQRTGRKVMVAFNITDELDEMFRHHDTVVAAGGTCVMVSLNSVGFVGLAALRRRCKLPIHGHRNGWGMLDRCPLLGVEFTAYQKLWRLVGIDQIHVNGLSNKFSESDESVVKSIKACLMPLFGGHEVLPVVGSGQWAGQASETYRRTGTVDLLFLSGGGIVGHPAGPAAGVRSLQQAWQAAVEGVALADYARTHVELRQALEKFAKVSHMQGRG
jgi:ribulose-bisphosphate carboxylase large chain